MRGPLETQARPRRGRAGRRGGHAPTRVLRTWTAKACLDQLRLDVSNGLIRGLTPGAGARDARPGAATRGQAGRQAWDEVSAEGLTPYYASLNRPLRRRETQRFPGATPRKPRLGTHNITLCVLDAPPPASSRRDQFKLKLIVFGTLWIAAVSPDVAADW